MSAIEQNGKEEDGKTERIYPVWLCVALEIRIEGCSLVQKAAKSLVLCLYKALKLMTAKHI